MYIGHQRPRRLTTMNKHQIQMTRIAEGLRSADLMYAAQVLLDPTNKHLLPKVEQRSNVRALETDLPVYLAEIAVRFGEASQRNARVNHFIHRPGKLVMQMSPTQTGWRQMWGRVRNTIWFKLRPELITYVGTDEQYHYFQARGLTTGFARLPK